MPVTAPVFMWLGIYEPSGWRHRFSLPIYFAIYILGYWLYRKNRREATA